MKFSDLGKFEFKCPGCGAIHPLTTWRWGMGGDDFDELKPSSKVQCWTCLSEFRADKILEVKS